MDFLHLTDANTGKMILVAPFSVAAICETDRHTELHLATGVRLEICERPEAVLRKVEMIARGMPQVPQLADPAKIIPFAACRRVPEVATAPPQ